MSCKDSEKLDTDILSNVDDSETVSVNKSHQRTLSKSKPNHPTKLSEDKNISEEKVSNKMFTYARETICFFLALAFTALAALNSS